MEDHGKTETCADSEVISSSISLKTLGEQKAGSDEVKVEMEENIANPVKLEEEISFDMTDETAMSQLLVDNQENIVPPDGAVTPRIKRVDKRNLRFLVEADETEENASTANEDRRLEYLLKRSEFYAKAVFAEGGGAGGGGGGSKSPKAGPSSAKRSRLSEPDKPENESEDSSEEDDTPPKKVVSKAVKEPIRFTTSPPFICNGAMRDYQVKGLNWMINLYNNGINGILADEMGLGKTLQTIALIGYLKLDLNISGHYLVIVPKSTLGNWTAEFERWCPVIRTVCLIGTKDERNDLIRNKLTQMSTWDVLVTSYEMVLRERGTLRKINWHYLVIDEAHRIKNEKSLLSEYVREFKSKNRLLLTGTPLQNNLHELWALLNFLLPKVFNSSENFDDWFDLKKCLRDTSLVDRLHAILRPFLLRRIKADVETGIPPKNEQNIYVPLSPLQRVWYKKLLIGNIEIINSAGSATKMRLHNLLMQLRKCANHPYLFHGVEPGPPYTTDSHLVKASGKLAVLDKLLAKLKQEGSRVLLFSQFKIVLDILEDYCEWKKYKFHRLDGSTDHEDRIDTIKEFNSGGSSTFIFMLTTRAGGLGINLASADVVILFDSDWNPQADIQAIDRAHRIGQTKTVRVFRLITENTVEEKMIERASIKRRLDKMVIQQGRLVNANTGPSAAGMLEMVRFGSKIILSSMDDDVVDETIETILDRSKLKNDELDERLDSGMDSKGLDGLKLGGESDEEEDYIMNFDGENYRPKPLYKKAELAIIMESVAPRSEKRVSKRVNYETEKTPKTPKPLTAKERLGLPPSLPIWRDFQFRPLRLRELMERETLHYRKTQNYMVQVVDDETLSPSGADRRRRAEHRKIEQAEPLSPSEKEEMDALLERKSHSEKTHERTGFCSWAKGEYKAFVKAVRALGRSDMARVAHFVPRKSLEEVTEYAEVFSKRYSELEDGDQIMADILKAESYSEQEGDVAVGSLDDEDVNDDKEI
ncbi:SWI/SNF-related matrix-associated actin-dependent regulator of chromatin subfamily A member 5 [Folsomia candida]|uniref:Putative global transcription activator SNF2L1 n=1 Tax=Folsomia candida TaxID=158441 RepID=A0A226D0P0_FOLCA|nr:SWI/SNF-related matrix-associated actin-dependent regulator of chromatin subfamily A member 5 [Folsomia candida]OXA38221.1 putative global transcription activator SNF2L1 [Folsomia candida]